MRRTVLLVLGLCLTVPVCAPTSHSTDAEYFQRLGNLFQHITERASPAVVSIRSVWPQSSGSLSSGRSRTPRTTEETGSGFIVPIADKTVILTNRHIIQQPNDEAGHGVIEIMTHDRRLLTITNVVSNAEFDLAVIEVAEALPNRILFGNSDKVHVGEIVLALGNPFGLDRSVSLGIISATERREVPGSDSSTPRVGFFQTDAAVNPGSSGGMLLNVRGEVVGILTAIATQGGRNEGVAFAMPSNVVRRVAEQLVQTGTVIKPHMGFGFETAIAPDERLRLGIDRQVGAKIRSVESDSPAEHSGLKVGDVVLVYNDIEVEDGLHVIRLVGDSAIGMPVLLRINRGGEVRSITVTPIAKLSR